MKKRNRTVVYGVALGLAIFSSLAIPKTKTKKVTVELVDANGVVHKLPDDSITQHMAAKIPVSKPPEEIEREDLKPEVVKEIGSDLEKLVDYGFTGKELMELHKIEDRDIRRKAFIQRFHVVAIVEQRRFGIPAAITLAQGILESNAGASDLARSANNYFGIKCHKRSHQGGTASWHCYNKHDDDPEDVFVRFDTPWESFRRHSKVLLKKRYKPCFENDPLNYYGWADQLKECGYATDPEYNVNVASLVERYDLNQFTEAALSLTIQ